MTKKRKKELTKQGEREHKKRKKKQIKKVEGNCEKRKQCQKIIFVCDM